MPSKNEVEVLRDQITEEVNRDAQVISTQLFPQSAQGREPDLVRVSDDDLKTLYRRKYMEQDRAWLQQEARRDPQQFTKIARSIGVVLPEEFPAQPSPATLPQITPFGASGVSAPQAPVAPPQPIPLPAAPLAQPQVPLIPGGLPQAPVGPPVALGPQPIVVPPTY